MPLRIAADVEDMGIDVMDIRPEKIEPIEIGGCLTESLRDQQR